MGYLQKKRDRRNYDLSHPKPVISTTEFRIMHDEMTLNRNIEAIKEELSKPWFPDLSKL